jgi:uncharacterized protein YdeI (YjbR/CyaY-like superfamily)
MAVTKPVDDYITSSTTWTAEMTALRAILVDSGLDEAIKWAKPCFSHEGRNIAILQPMKPHLALMFFKGALLNDPHGVLHDQGPNSRSAKRMEFTSVDDVSVRREHVVALVAEAIDVEDAGLEVGPPPALDLVPELTSRLDADPALKAAFEALTPGRQREYNLHFSSAKQSATRQARVDKCVARILSGRGVRDR